MYSKHIIFRMILYILYNEQSVLPSPTLTWTTINYENLMKLYSSFAAAATTEKISTGFDPNVMNLVLC